MKSFAAGKGRSLYVRTGIALKFCVCFVMVTFQYWVATAESDQSVIEAAALKRLTLEELVNLEVTSVSRRPEPWFTTASAVQVITAEDIQRSGASSLPEALRLAPNLQVSQVDSRQWAISARGFNNGLANKLLVMIDGRTVYTPLFAGVFWDAQDTLMEDLERIEVVSGPGTTLWGANAVNGVINIVTRSAAETQGTLITGGGGSLLRDFGGARYGGQLGLNVYYRVYGKYFDRNPTVTPSGRDGTNDWRMGQGGFRVDWLPDTANTITLQGDGYAGEIRQPLGDLPINGQNVIGRWTHTIAEGSDFNLQVYWDRTLRQIPGSIEEALNTEDVDFQHRFPVGARQSIVWGASYRLMIDRVKNGPAAAFLPEDRNMELFGGFVQDEIVIVPDKLQITLGSKLEHNEFSGLEVQPSGRIAGPPGERQPLWAAVSRAVRSPSRIDTDLFTPGAPPYVIAGGSGFDSEKLVAYELGYRFRPADALTVSLAGFFNDYDDIRSLEPIATNTFVFRNSNRAEIYGLEISITYEVKDWWRLRGGYTYLHKDVFIKPSGSDLNQGRAEGNDPTHVFMAQSILDLPRNIELDLTVRYVDDLPSPAVPGFFTADVHLGWRPCKRLELSIVGQNLCDNQHPEFGEAASRQEIPRSVYGKVTWTF
jgi:Outer membrane receptor for ferrienterochelin and colicins